MTDPIREALRILLNEIDDLSVLGKIPSLREAVDEARTALAAEPPAPDPREALAARPLLEAVARLGDCIGQHTVGEITTISDRAAAWLAENPPGQPVAIEPRGCPTPGACSCVEPPAPAPVADHIPDARNMALATDYAARLRQCHTHGQLPANAWGCPECLRELREELARLRGLAADGEREELAQWLDWLLPAFHREHDSTHASNCLRAAALLRQPAPAPVPVPVAEQPWKRPGWCDAEGRCWWGRCADDFFNPEWTMATLADIEEFCSDAMPQHCLPHWAIPQPPQGGEVGQ